jgi:hypothetical protein
MTDAIAPATAASFEEGRRVSAGTKTYLYV